MKNVLNQIEILDLLDINVYNPNIYNPGVISVDIQPLDKTKRVVIDSDALEVLNEILKDRANTKFEDARDPKLKKDLEEFVGRMCIEWHKHGLLILEDMPDSPSDPYEEAKKKVTEELRRKGLH